MPVGVIINGLSIILGGITGTLVAKNISPQFKINITLIFGLCSMGMGVNSIVLMENMPVVIFSIVIGTAIGLGIKLSKRINTVALQMQKIMGKLVRSTRSEFADKNSLGDLVTVIILFCASGTGIYGSMMEGITGDSSILISKSILDFFTAAIFACNLGYVVSAIAIPQIIIGIGLFFGSYNIMLLTTQNIIADFKACGGFLMLATGFRMIKLKEFPIADMIPAMILVIPLSWLWINYIIPLL